MFVLTADQHASTRVGDRVEDLLEQTAAWVERRDVGADVALPMERTVGDEVQTVLRTPEVAVELALYLHRLGGWAVGIGAGPVDEPLAETSRASSGTAFVNARTAVERARSRAVPVAVVVCGPAARAAEHATALLQMLAAVLRRRSAAGWEAVDLVAQGLRQAEAAERLGITDQAVSQRLATALYEEELALHPLAHELLAQAQSPEEGR